MENYNALLARMADLEYLGTAQGVLHWDQQCYMPPKGVGVRAQQLATLGKISHEMFVANETRKLLEGAEAEVAGLDPDSDEAATVRIVRRDFDKSTKIPTELVTEMAKARAEAHEVWVKARKASDWSVFQPTLSHLLDLTRRVVDHLGYSEHPYDALLDQYEPGVTTATVTRVFDELRPGLVELVQAIAAAPQIDNECLKRDFPEDKQKTFSEMVVQKLGYDTEAGRLDTAVHPFCIGFGRNDVRITTRYDRNWLPCALMGSIHEAGHALYEQGFAPGDDGTPRASAASLGFHESQSRLWENIVGRSRTFWKNFYQPLQQHFAPVLDDVDEETFYRAINQVEPSMIRVEADEVTYNLHILLRFEVEKALIEGSLAVADVPSVWNAKMQEYLGITPANDAEGCLQDVHWSEALFGYFPTYSLGTLLSAQLYGQALKDNPAIGTDLENGEYASLLAWLREKVHYPGRRYMPGELVQRICGEPPQSVSYLRYLNDKYRAVYGIE
ncbi:MAG: carboxypeptidase M32 [Armatimonadaceae bacterium]